MKKLGKSTKKGFTLVELIVVLVILAVLAAMLVPALVGYIDRAKAEKEYQTAATVYGAAQAVITELYAKDEFTTGQTFVTTGQQLKSMGNVDAVLTLAGVENVTYKFTFDANSHIIDDTDSWVVVSGAKYTLSFDDTTGAPSWSAAKVASGSGSGNNAQQG